MTYTYQKILFEYYFKVPFQKTETFVVDWSIMSNSIASHKQLIPNIMASTMESTR